jgi:hypothetical protein
MQKEQAQQLANKVQMMQKLKGDRWYAEPFMVTTNQFTKTRFEQDENITPQELLERYGGNLLKFREQCEKYGPAHSEENLYVEDEDDVESWISDEYVYMEWLDTLAQTDETIVRNLLNGVDFCAWVQERIDDNGNNTYPELRRVLQSVNDSRLP